MTMVRHNGNERTLVGMLERVSWPRFARLPAAARGPNEAIMQRALRALAPLREEMGFARTEHVPLVVNPNLMFPIMSQHTDVTHVGRSASGAIRTIRIKAAVSLRFTASKLGFRMIFSSSRYRPRFTSICSAWQPRAVRP